MTKTVLVTGAAGFIGMHVSRRLLDEGYRVIGIDNLDDYYDVALKQARLAQLDDCPAFSFRQLDIVDRKSLTDLFSSDEIRSVVHLAAQAGVRYSLENPHAYGDSNLSGFLNVLENCRHFDIEHLVFASSSSVYGNNSQAPFKETDNVDHPISLYAATKKANELMAYSYAHLYGTPVTGLRFFTVYGPWGRPDMAYYSFTRAILAGETINVFNHGDLKRDFTYIDDIVEGVVRVLLSPPTTEADAQGAPYRIYNIGHHTPVRLLDFIATLEKCLDKNAHIRFQPMQPGDMFETCADVDALARDTGFSPVTDLSVGLSHFVHWYLDYHRSV